MTRIEAAAENRNFADEVAIYFRARVNDRWALAQPVEFVIREEGLLTDPALRMRREDAQTLMDSLWGCGLRPTLGKQSEGVTAAQARHLEDMRALAFAKLKVDAPR